MIRNAGCSLCPAYSYKVISSYNAYWCDLVVLDDFVHIGRIPGGTYTDGGDAEVLTEANATKPYRRDNRPLFPDTLKFEIDISKKKIAYTYVCT